MQLQGQHVLILGLGASGLAMARWCAQAGADVTVADTNATFSTTGLGVTWFSGGTGLQPVVAAQLFIVNRAITSDEQLAIYRAANMLPDKANPRSLKNLRFGYSVESIDGVFIPQFYSSPEAISDAASRNNCTYMRELFAWKNLEATQGNIDWSAMDRVVDAHQANGINILGVFYNYSPSWAIPAGMPNIGTVPGSATKGISVAAADSNATNGGKGNGAYSTWRDRSIAFVVAAVHRYKDRIFEWELGNENNTSLFGGPAASAPLFVDWYNHCRTAVLAELGADAWKHQIALAGLCRWRSEAGTTDANSYLGEEFLRAILDLGIDAFDRAALHPYLSTNGDPAVHTVNGLNLDGVLALRDVLMEHGRTPTIEIGEMGWFTEDTTIASASNGLTLPQSSITVEDATRLPYGTGGTVYVQTSLGYQAVTYTNKSGNTLTGCTGGTGVISTGGLVSGSSDKPISEADAAQYLSSFLALVRDCMSSFCDSVYYHTISGTYGGAGYLMAYRDVSLLSPKPMVGHYKRVAALHDPRQARPVLTPLVGAPIATSGNPSMGAVNIYDATSAAIAAQLPPLARLAVGARLIVGKSDSTDNTVTLSCNGSDAFLDGSTSVAFIAGMQREIQVIEVSDVKVWAFLGPSPQSVADNSDGTATI